MQQVIFPYAIIYSFAGYHCPLSSKHHSTANTEVIAMCYEWFNHISSSVLESLMVKKRRIQQVLQLTPYSANV